MSTKTDAKITYTGIRRKRIYPESVRIGIMFPIDKSETKFIRITKAFVVETIGKSPDTDEFWSYLSAEYRGDGSVMPDKCTPVQWVIREYVFWSSPDDSDDE